MELAMEQRLAARAKVLKAMAHPLRLAIVQTLAEGGLCVGEIAEVLAADQPTVSKHLATLREAGVVLGARDGASVRYGLACPCAMDFMRCVDEVVATHQRRLRQAL